MRKNICGCPNIKEDLDKSDIFWIRKYFISHQYQTATNSNSVCKLQGEAEKLADLAW